MKNSSGILCVSCGIVLILVVSSCATFNPRPIEEVPFQVHAKTKSDRDLTVTVAVLSEEQSKQVFGVDLYDERIQPIWLEIENRSDKPWWFLPIRLDPDYFSHQEAAWKSHFFLAGSANKQMDQYFNEQHLSNLLIPPGGSNSGFVFTNLDQGVKVVNVELFCLERVQRFEFIIEVPGMKIDYKQVRFDTMYDKDQIVEYDEKGLRKALEALPCCTLGGDLKTPGDPLNLVIIGHGIDVLSALVRRGWDLTETLHSASVWNTMKSSLFGSKYRHAPVSPLHVYGRRQDAAFQKARETVDARNHLRLWLTPMRYEGKPVWVGQISRDIGVRLSSKTIVTHKIDPDVDEAREYLLQDLLVSESVAKFGFVKGVGPASLSEPRYNYTDDPYYTDGLRAVLVIGDKPTFMLDAEFFEWERPYLGRD